MTQELRHLHFGSEVRVAIQVLGTVPESWRERLGGLTVSTTWQDHAAPCTTLVGSLRDQPALMGVLNTLHDLGLSLVSMEVERLIRE